MKSFFGCLTDEQRRFFFDRSRERRFETREVVFHEGDLGDTLHVVRRGRLAVLLRTPRGQLILDIAGPEDCLGELAVLLEARRSATVTALEPTHTREISRQDFNVIRQSNRQIDAAMLEGVGERLRDMTSMIRLIMFMTVEERVTRELAMLTASYRNDGDASVIIPIAQGHLADLVGATRQTVNRCLAELRAQGLLASTERKKQVVVSDPDGLIKLGRKLDHAH